MTMTLPSMERSVLIIRHKRRWYELKLPHAVFINGQFLGMIKERDVRIIAPAGSYSLRVQFGGRIPIGKRGKSIDLSVSSTEQVQLSPQTTLPRGGVKLPYFPVSAFRSSISTATLPSSFRFR